MYLGDGDTNYLNATENACPHILLIITQELTTRRSHFNQYDNPRRQTFYTSSKMSTTPTAVIIIIATAM